jgi:hypothetical protein
MDSLSRIKELVGRGSYFTILAPVAAYDCAARGEFVASRIVDPIMTRSVYMLRKLTRRQACVTSNVEQITCDVIQDLVGRGIWQVSKNLMDACAENEPAAGSGSSQQNPGRSNGGVLKRVHAATTGSQAGSKRFVANALHR